MNADSGLLIAFEGLDQSGKQTQAELLRDRLTSDGRSVRLLSFPDYETVSARRSAARCAVSASHSAEVMQLLYVANRFEWKGEIVRAKDAGTILVCDRHLRVERRVRRGAGARRRVAREIQKYLPQPDTTFLLDIAPDVSADRKTLNRDKYESDLSLLSRVRDSYRRQASRAGWTRLGCGSDWSAVAADVWKTVACPANVERDVTRSRCPSRNSPRGVGWMPSPQLNGGEDQVGVRRIAHDLVEVDHVVKRRFRADPLVDLVPDPRLLGVPTSVGAIGGTL